MLADLQLNTKRDQVLLKLKNGPVWVYGPTGSGRSSLMVELKKALDVVDVEPPGLGDVDAPIHALAQCAAGGAGTAAIVFEKQSLYERARRLAMELSSAKKTLVVRAPASWTFGAGSESADDLRRKQDALQVLEGWLSVKRVVLMTATLEDEDRLAHRFPSDQSVNLKRAGLRRDALEDGTLWGPCLAAAKDVGDAMDTAHFTMTPLQARLAVGLVALGEAPETLIAELKHVNSSSTLRPLVDRLRAVLQEHRPALWTGLQAVAQARFPLPVEQVLDLASGHENDRVLLTQCIGYGTEMVRLAEPVRDVLLEHASAGEESHRKLARYYQGRDGATSPLQLTDAPLFAWLEKAHHLAHVLSEPGRDQRWEDLDCPSKHLLWDRARSLSRHFCRYSEAAELYRKSVELYGDDDYAWHYLAFNLHRSGEGLPEAASAYRKAVQPTWRNDSPNVAGSGRRRILPVTAALPPWALDGEDAAA